MISFNNKYLKYFILTFIIVLSIFLIKYSAIKISNVKIIYHKQKEQKIKSSTHKEPAEDKNIQEEATKIEQNIVFPYNKKSTSIKEYIYTGIITRKILSRRVIKIIPDDCIEYIKINNINVSLAHIDKNSLCDWTNGFKLNIGPYLKIGENEFEIKVNDKGSGQYGLSVDSIASGDPFCIFLTILIIISIILIVFFLFQEPPKTKKNSKSSKTVLKTNDEISFLGTPSIKIIAVFIFFILIISYFTYFHNYSKPQAVFWDENYHIASAQKYIKGVMFMEPHPPLGKMLIALGEILVRPNKNIDTSSFLATDYVKNFPAGYSFAGMRLASTFFAMLSSILFFLILFYLFKNPLYAFLFTFLYLFENAFIVHSRSAMLEGIQFFFIFSTILYFVYIFQKRDRFTLLNYFVLGILTGLAVSVKINSGILILLFIFLAFHEYWDKFIKRQINHKIIKALLLKVVLSLSGILLILISVWYLHFSIASTPNKGRYYKASAEYKKILTDKTTLNPFNFYVMLRDNNKYMSEYQKGVPKLDVCKKGENGSHPTGWLIGKKTINYRWAKNMNKVSYLYLQGNPLNWLIGLISIILSFILIGGHFLFGLQIKDKRIFKLIVFFTILYTGYMITMLMIDRVMYLYHYFIPLIFTYFNSYLLFNYLFSNYINTSNKKIMITVSVIAVSIVLVFLFFSHLTYYKPLTGDQFAKRAWLKCWKLERIK